MATALLERTVLLYNVRPNELIVYLVTIKCWMETFRHNKINYILCNPFQCWQWSRVDIIFNFTKNMVYVLLISHPYNQTYNSILCNTFIFTFTISNLLLITYLLIQLYYSFYYFSCMHLIELLFADKCSS